MIVKELKEISEDYYTFLKNENKFIPLENESIEFYSPLVDYFGESISLNITKKNDIYVISDFGDTLWNLEQAGIDLLKDKKSKKYDIFNSLLSYDGIILTKDNYLSKTSNKKALSQNLHDFVNVVASISDLAVLRRENIKHLFREEVINYFLSHREDLFPNVIPDVKIDGKSKLSHRFDLVFPGIKTDFVKILRTTNKSNIKNTLFDWEDVAEYRDRTYKTDSKLNIITEDTSELNSEVQMILNQYDVTVIDFGNKEALKDQLSLISN